MSGFHALLVWIKTHECHAAGADQAADQLQGFLHRLVKLIGAHKTGGDGQQRALILQAAGEALLGAFAFCNLGLQFQVGSFQLLGALAHAVFEDLF